MRGVTEQEKEESIHKPANVHVYYLEHSTFV